MYNGVALLGEPGSGKTTIGNALLELEGGMRLSFAGALKNELANGLAFVEDYGFDRQAFRRHRAAMDDPATKDTYRSILQWWGSLRRAEYEDHWAHKVLDQMVYGGFYVVDDCRYWNEYRMLSDAGFAFVSLGPGETTRRLTGEQAAHPSEQDWPSFPPNLVLPYQRGPAAQAARISEWLHSDYVAAVPV